MPLHSKAGETLLSLVMIRPYGTVIFIVFFALSGCRQVADFRFIKVMGSDSEVNLVLSMAEKYMQRDSLASIGIIGGGSGMGIASLINQRAQLANSSRELTEKETNLLKEKNIEILRLVFALDAIAFVVHKDHPLDTITLSQVSELYQGNIRDWSEISRQQGPVRLYGRQSNSGTYLYLRDQIVKAEYHNSLLGLNGNAQILEAIRQDVSGIGYVSVGYLEGKSASEKQIKVLMVKNEENGNCYSPLSQEDLKAGLYPVQRPLLQFLALPASDLALDFVQFELSAEGQDMIRKNGYLPLDTLTHQQMLKALTKARQHEG